MKKEDLKSLINDVLSGKLDKEQINNRIESLEKLGRPNLNIDCSRLSPEALVEAHLDYVATGQYTETSKFLGGPELISLREEENYKAIVHCLKRIISLFPQYAALGKDRLDHTIYYRLMGYVRVLDRLVTHFKEIKEEDLIQILNFMTSAESHCFTSFRYRDHYPIFAVLRLLVKHIETNKIDDRLAKPISLFLVKLIVHSQFYPTIGRELDTLREYLLLNGYLIDYGEAWSECAIEFLQDIKKQPHIFDVWLEMINHALSLKNSKPTKKWLNTIEGIISKIGETEFLNRVEHWMSIVNLGRVVPIQDELADHSHYISHHNRQILVGLIWGISVTTNTLESNLRELSEWAFILKDRELHCSQVGTACLNVLARSPKGLSEIEKLKVNVEAKAPTRQIEKALKELSKSTK